MKPAYDFNGVTLYQGDSAEVLKALPDASVHCIITSPPYFALRDYKTGTWEGGAEGCDHKAPPRGGRDPATSSKQLSNAGTIHYQYPDTCGKCGARRIDKQIGLEPTVEAHLEALLRVFRECYRVLRPDGVMAVNYGDSYACSSNGRSAADTKAAGNDDRTFRDKPFDSSGFLPAKNLLGMPWRLAFALQAEGWILRSALPFFKVTAMPESCRDRPTTAHEYVFLFVKQARYWYDGDAVRPSSTASKESLNRYRYGKSAGIKWVDAQDGAKVDFCSGRGKEWPSARNFRTSDVYPLALADQLEAVDAELERLSLLRCHLEKLTTARGLLTDPDGEPLALNLVSEPTKESHFAAFGTNLVKPLLLSGCPETVCAKCGAGYVREVERSEEAKARLGKAWHDHQDNDVRGQRIGFTALTQPDRITLGFSPSCKCAAGTAPGVVLDPFAGTGTVAYVARALGRRAIGIELSREYLDIARRRLRQGSLFLTDGEEEEGT